MTVASGGPPCGVRSSYHANGGGRDTYIHRDDRVFKGVSEATPREQAKNPPGLIPRPPSSMARGSRATGYTGHLPGKAESVGKGFSEISERKDYHNLIPALRLKHRFVDPPSDGWNVTSRDYGSKLDKANTFREPTTQTRNGATTKGRKNTEGSQTERPSPNLMLPRIRSLGYTGYHDPTVTKNNYWKLHTVGQGPPSPRVTQRSTTQDGNTGYSRPLQEEAPEVGRQIQGLTGLPQGYGGYRPRFRFATGVDRADVSSLTSV